ncbi:MAG: CPBP family intramembrane metalloprotease [Amylibacter sp.]
MKGLRWAELIVLYIAVPFVLAMFLPPSALYPVLGTGAIVGTVLLHFTVGFRWRDLIGPVRILETLALGIVTFGVASLLCWLILPERLWYFLIHAPKIMIWIAFLYPLIQVVPQELVYRALFFERYSHLFSGQKQAVLVNAGLFSFGHLMYWHPVVWTATFIGSFMFSYAYLRPRGFLQACALHGIAGVAIFASGLGWLFYSGGNVAQ